MSPALELTEQEFEKFRVLIYRVCGIQIPATKRVMVSNRLRRRLRATGIASFASYYQVLTSPGSAADAELPRFLDEITTNETYFYRDPHHFEWLGDTYLPEIIKQGRLGKRPKSLRVWSAAASTGEELYSVAMKILERKHEMVGWRSVLLGTDLSEAALTQAKAGKYDDRAVRLVTPEQRRQFLEHDAAAKRWSLKPEVLGMTSWLRHNLITPLKKDPFDVIFIKNVLIYFDQDSKRTVVKNLLAAMAPGGYLVVGPTEGIHAMLGPLTRHHSWLYQRGDSDVRI